MLKQAEYSAMCTHNHKEGIRGAQAVAAAIYWARRDNSNKAEISNHIEKDFGYYLHPSLDEIRKTYKFDESCQGTVPAALTAFLESENFEHAIQLAISIGGDSDTIAAITGSVAEAYYREVPKKLRAFALEKLTPEMCDAVLQFEATRKRFAQRQPGYDWYFTAMAGLDWEHPENLPPSELMTEDLLMAALEDAPLCLQYVPEDKKTFDLCYYAVFQDDDAIQYVPDDIRAAVKDKKDSITEDEWLSILACQTGNHSIWLPKRLLTPEFLHKMVERNGSTINFIPDELQTPELIALAKENEDNWLSNLHANYKSSEPVELQKTAASIQLEKAAHV
jgi:hypothetical protein